MRRGGIVAVIVAVTAGPAGAQPLEAFLEAAHARNPTLEAARLEAVGARLDRGEAIATLVPSLNVTGRLIRNQFAAEIEVPAAPGAPPEQLTIIPLTQTQLDISFTVPLVRVSNWLRIGAAHTAAQAADRQSEATGHDVAISVVRAWTGVAGARAVADATRRAVTASEELVRVTTLRMEEGVGTEIDVSRARAELAERQRLFAQASAMASVQALLLEKLTGLEARTISLNQSLSLAPESDLEGWRAMAAEQPEVSAARLRAQAADEQARAAWMQLVPTLDASAVQTFTNATGFADSSTFWTAQLVATIPLQPGFVAQAKRLGAQARQLHALATLAFDDAAQEISEAWYAVSRLTAQVTSAREQLRAAQVAARLIEARYEAGTASSLEVRESRREAILAESTLLQDESELLAARAILRLTTGLPWNATGPEAR